MIKETIDTVRTAELEAEKLISKADENAQDKKNHIKSQGEDYKTEALKEAKEKAALEMENTVQKCNDFNEQVCKDIEGKIAEMKKGASGRMEEAVNAVINALV